MLRISPPAPNTPIAIQLEAGRASRSQRKTPKSWPPFLLNVSNNRSGNSTTVKVLTEPQGISGHWKALPQTTRTVIIACAIGGFVVLLIAVIVFCVVQGRKGKKERAIADAQYAKEQQESNEYRMRMMKGGFSQSSQPFQQRGY
jgi:hypothetical protein